MAKDTADNHYEEKFEFPLWKMIKQRAEEKDISYVRASQEVLPEWDKDIRYREAEFVDAAVKKRHAEIAEVREYMKKLKKSFE